MDFKKKNDYLSITDKIIKYTDGRHTEQVYQLSNITQIKKRKLTHKRIAKVVISIALAAGGVAIVATKENDLQPIAAAAIILSIVLFLWSLLRRSHYALILETSSGTGEVLVSKSEKFIDQLVSTITDVMERQIEGTNITAYPKDFTVINNSYTKNVTGDDVAGDKFENIKNSAIANRSAGAHVSNSLISNYGEGVGKALDELAHHISACNDEGSAAVLAKLKESMSQPEPDKSRVTALWNTLVRILPDVSKVTTSIAAIAGAIL